ncbi:hypothetical protein [Mycolicibacterium sp.]|uniref:hypothetical protein n=1 Tax=Mycolicibacterium sp. TaxID=2320850 RepID=UPI00355F239E
MTDRKIFKPGRDPFLMTTQKWWEGRIHNPDLALDDRIFAVAIARCAPNLHCPMGKGGRDEKGAYRGELVCLLGEQTGTYPSRAAVWKAIKKLIEAGYLDPNSSRDCLILPVDGFENNLRGQNKPCPQCTGKASKMKKNFVVRDFEAEALIGDIESSVRKVQARAVLGFQNGNQRFPDRKHEECDQSA